jgi:succinyl-CoA synthetase beta subunit
VVNAVKDIDVKVPIVIRLVGTNEEEGRRVLKESGMNFVAENNLPDAAKKVVELAS